MSSPDKCCKNQKWECPNTGDRYKVEVVYVADDPGNNTCDIKSLGDTNWDDATVFETDILTHIYQGHHEHD